MAVRAGEDEGDGTLDVDAYCRTVETHLCRKNDGHLIRVSGPAFEMVRGWAEQGIPLGVVRAGIDRTFERYYSRGPRRRPVHISYCEADVLDAFDAWRRALGVPLVPGREGPAEAEPHDHERHGRGASLPAHLERVVNRLTVLRAGAAADRALDAALEAAVREVDGMRAAARHARGDARASIVAALDEIDRGLLALAGARVGTDDLAAVDRQADAELAPFRERMTAEAYGHARAAARDRLLRAAVGLPVIRYDG